MEERKEVVTFKRSSSGRTFCCHSFIHSFRKHVLTSYLGPGACTAAGCGETTVPVTQSLLPEQCSEWCSMGRDRVLNIPVLEEMVRGVPWKASWQK